MRRQLQALTGTEEFRALAAEIPELRKILDQARSITIGVNLSPDLMPESAAILSISPERIEGRHPILGRLLGARHEHQAITPLRSGITTHVKGQEVNAFTQDLRRLVDAVADPVARALARYTTVNARVLARLSPELAFFLNAVALSEKLRAAGLSTCVASIARARCPANQRAAIARSQVLLRTRIPKHMSRCGLPSTTGAGPACRSTFAPASIFPSG
jgi:hypothetical protein